jgi:hypothetical protein
LLVEVLAVPMEIVSQVVAVQVGIELLPDHPAEGHLRNLV